MAVKSLAVKYRPTTFDDVVGQEAIKTILQQQLDTGTIKNVYLFCGGAGTGKTTCARIFANELNNHRCLAIITQATRRTSGNINFHLLHDGPAENPKDNPKPSTAI